MNKTLIFQLGTNNWQRQGEFAPGSGILHEAHHHAYNAMEGVDCYSIYPSKMQTSDDVKVKIFSIDHDIPICESVSPISSYRFHSMSDDEFSQYIVNLKTFTEQSIEEAERIEGRPIDLAIAHHTFINPLVLAQINRERQQAGRPKFKLLCFAHGTALKMYEHEKAGIDPEYPSRFLPFMQGEGVFDAENGIDACAAISNEQLEKFSHIFDTFPKEKMILSPNGYDPLVFKPDDSSYVNRQAILSKLTLADSPIHSAPKRFDSNPDKVVIFCGKFADWKRLDVVLKAASLYEKSANIATIIIGSGPPDAIAQYHHLAYEQLKLKNTWFVGPQPHAVIAQLNAMADVGVYPSRNEPFGLVLIEAMACGTPVIGANSGGPRDFVNQNVGELVKECEGDELVQLISATIERALSEDWKKSKGGQAAIYAAETFSVDTQCRQLLIASMTV